MFRTKNTRVNTKSSKNESLNPKNNLNFIVDRKLTTKWNENWKNAHHNDKSSMSSAWFYGQAYQDPCSSKNKNNGVP